MRCKDSKQHHVMFHELYSVSLRLCIAQNVRFEIPYKVLYFETPFLIIFKCYAWVSCEETRTRAAAVINKSTRNEKFKLKVIGTSPKTYELVIILKKTTQLVMF